jgi:NADPH2:quinone reductase
VWKGLKEIWENGLLKPAVFDNQYLGLESVVPALKDLSGRKVWGKAVVFIEEKTGKLHL